MQCVGFVLVLILLSLTSSTISQQTFSENEDILVRVNHGGRVQGMFLTSDKGKTFYGFKGIPYAEPPVGQLRFKPPKPKPSWKDSIIFDATKNGGDCPQPNGDKMFFGQEDCLYLNVYTPELPYNCTNGGNRSVIVYIHGGGFIVGSGKYEQFPPGRMMDSNIVFVTMNYRLNALGFLSTMDASSPGNYGLLDQTLALQWVKDNIKAFGGNPQSVTILGESTGGSCIGYHLLSRKSAGLFHKAIEMSGSLLSPYHFMENPLKWTNLLAFETKCLQNNTLAMVECLRGVSIKDLLFALDPYSTSTFINDLFLPTVDGQFLTDTPRNTFKYMPENINQVPVISGCTETEAGGSIYRTEISRPNVSLTSQESFDYLFNNVIGNHDVNISRMIRDHYVKPIDPSKEFEARKAVAKAYSDGSTRMPVYEEIQHLLEAGLTVYVYSYDYGTTHPIGPDKEERKYGIHHGEDLLMLFNLTSNGQSLPFKENDQRMADTLTGVWSTFAKSGHPDPSHAYLPQWKPSSPELFHILHFNESITIEDYDINKDSNYIFWSRDVLAARNKTKV